MNKPYGLIIMDAQMPLMDGFAATQAIRARKDNPCCRIPIIAMTAFAMPEDRERCLQAGMSDCMAKPVVFEKLEAMINKCAIDLERIPLCKRHFSQGRPVLLKGIDSSTAVLIVPGF